MSKYRVVLDKDGLYMPQEYHSYIPGYQGEGFKDMKGCGFLTLEDAKRYIETQKNAGKVVWESD